MHWISLGENIRPYLLELLFDYYYLPPQCTAGWQLRDLLHFSSLSTEHWADLIPQRLHWLVEAGRGDRLSPWMLWTDSQHIFTVMHLCDLCIPVMWRAHVCTPGFTASEYCRKWNTLKPIFFLETFWYIISSPKVYFQPCIFFIECCLECFSFWQVPFASLGTLIDVEMDADKGNGIGSCSWWKEIKFSCTGVSHLTFCCSSSGLCTLSFYLPNPELRPALSYILLCKLRHTLRALETGLCECCLCVQTTASTTGVVAFCLLPCAQHPLHSSSEPPSKVTRRLGLRFLKGKHTIKGVQLWSNHSRTSLETHAQDLCAPHHLQTTTCSHSGDLPAMWDSAGVTGQRDFLVCEVSSYSKVSLS